MGNEINRILKLFADLQHGDCWIGTNFKEALHAVDAETACRSLPAGSNTIWQLIAHLIYWRTTVTNRLQGSTNPPPFPDFLLPENLTEQHWKQTLMDHEAAYHLLRNAINAIKEEDLDKPSCVKGQTIFQLILGCLQHDAYHLGQVALLKK